MSSINFLLFLAIHRAISTPPEAPDTAYASWCRQFSISACAGWSPEERAYRATVINANFATAKAATTESVTYGLTRFSFQTFDEFSAAHLGLGVKPASPQEAPLVGPRGLRPRASSTRSPTRTAAGLSGGEFTVDWRAAGNVAVVKDQGSCGSCYAFSAVAAIEAAVAIKTGLLATLSEQELVDCSGSYGNAGCGGGWMSPCFAYAKDNGGLSTQTDYPCASASSPLALRSRPRNELPLKRAGVSLFARNFLTPATPSMPLPTSFADTSGSSKTSGVCKSSLYTAYL